MAKAYEALNVDRMTVKNAAKDDETFSQGIKSAASDGYILHLKRIFTASSGWQASAWFLERKHWEEYAQRRPEHFTVQDVMAIAVHLAEVCRRYIATDQHDAFLTDFEGVLKSGMTKKKKKVKKE